MTIKIPFTVIGGYLGAGKTTLLNHLLGNTQGLRIAVLVNDFGSVNIDVNLIRSHEGDTINLANGCMCCSIANNLAMVMNQLRDRAADLDHIIIEASGVANPGKIAQYGQMYQLPLDGVIVVADAEQVQTQARNKYVGDTVLRQFDQADLIILNKVDLVSTADLARLRQWLTDIAPDTPRYETTYATVPASILLGTRQYFKGDHSLSTGLAALGHPGLKDDHAQQFETLTLQKSCPIATSTLQTLPDELGAEVYRVKGVVYLAEDPLHRYVYQQVGPRWSLVQGEPWCKEPPHTQLVVIGQRGMSRVSAVRAWLEGDHDLTACDRNALADAPTNIMC